MTEMMKIIAETEGVRTPSRKRSKKEVAEAFDEFTKKRATAKKAKAKTAKSAKPKKAKAEKAPEPVAAVDIDRVKVSANPGNIVAAGFDPATGRMHVEFSASVYEYPDTDQTAWDAFKATFEDKETDTGSYFRKNFRGKTFRKVNQPKAAKAASAESAEEVQK